MILLGSSCWWYGGPRPTEKSRCVVCLQSAEEVYILISVDVKVEFETRKSVRSKIYLHQRSEDIVLTFLYRTKLWHPENFFVESNLTLSL